MNRRILIGIVVAMVAAHAWLIVENLAMDGDTLRVAGQVVRTSGFRGSLVLFGPKVVLYAAQSPLLWLTAKAGAIVRPAWSPISASRLGAILAIAAIAWLLAALAREAGAGPAGQCAAAVLPFCWHGFSFLAASCDDNVATDALRLAAVLAAVRWLSVPPGGRRHLAVGGWLGAALCWHFQSSLLIPAIAVAGVWGWRSGGAVRVRETVAAIAAGVAVWAAWTGVCVAAGRPPVPSLAALATATVENHRDASLWLLSSPRSLWAQPALVWEGWSRMVLGFGWLRPSGGGVAAGAAVALAAGLLGVSIALIRGTVLGRVIIPVLAIEIAHSLLYESESIERWDVPALLAGLALVVAVRGAGPSTPFGRSGRGLAAVGGILAVLLAVCNVTAYARFVRDAEPALLEVIAGRRAVPDLTLDCVGGHWRLCRAAREFAAMIGPYDGFGGIVQGKAADVYHQYWLTNWASIYLMCYAPGFLDRPGMRTLSLCLLKSDPPGWRVVRREGFVCLLEPARPGRPQAP